jgi:DNA-binding MarR family transcriptional regulator
MAASSEKLLEQFRYFTNLIHRERYRPDRGVNGVSLNRSQGWLLGLLVNNDGLSQTELSRKMQIRTASLGELVSKLEQSGYVERRTNEKDKRVFNVYLTAEGRKVVHEVTAVRQAMLDTVFSGLTGDEKDQLAALMGKLIDWLEKDSGSPMDAAEQAEMMRRGPEDREENEEFLSRPGLFGQD